MSKMSDAEYDALMNDEDRPSWIDLVEQIFGYNPFVDPETGEDFSDGCDKSYIYRRAVRAYLIGRGLYTGDKCNIYRIAIEELY